MQADGHLQSRACTRGFTAATSTNIAVAPGSGSSIQKPSQRPRAVRWCRHPLWPRETLHWPSMRWANAVRVRPSERGITTPTNGEYQEWASKCLGISTVSEVRIDPPLRIRRCESDRAGRAGLGRDGLWHSWRLGPSRRRCGRRPQLGRTPGRSRNARRHGARW